REGPSFPCQTAVSWNPQKLPFSVSNQTQRVIIVCEGGLGRFKYGSNQIVVEEWRPKRKLGLFQSEYAVMVPWTLLENGKGQGVPLYEACICLTRLMGEKFRTEQPGQRLHGLKSADLPEDFSSIVSCHSDRCNLARLLVYVHIRSAANIDASIGEVHC